MIKEDTMEVETIEAQLVAAEAKIKCLQHALRFLTHQGIEHGKVSFGEESDYYSQNSDWGWKSAEYLNDSDTIAFGAGQNNTIYLLPDTLSIWQAPDNGIRLEVIFTLPMKNFEPPKMPLRVFCQEHNVDTSLAGTLSTF